MVIAIVFSLIIIGAFFFFFQKLENQVNDVRRSLKSAIQFLERFKSGIKKEDLTSIKNFFDIDDVLQEPWEEFSETLIVLDGPDEKIYNTEQAENYFNEESIINYKVQVTSLSATPSFLAGLGLIGTFISILFGLLHIEVNPINQEVTGIEELINGLKSKFCSSIFGLGFALIFSFIYNKKITEIEKLTSKLSRTFNQIFARNLPEKALIKISDNLENIYTEIRKLNGSEDIDNKYISSLTKELDGLKQNISENFKLTNENLEKAINKLSKGATEEIIKALEEVIKDFNENLTSQFGDNFKELNSAVFKLLEWQDNYKTSLEIVEANLKTTINSIQSVDSTLGSIAQRNKDVMEVYNQLETIIQVHNSQLVLINQRLDDYSKLNTEAKSLIEQFKNKMNESFIGLDKLTEKIQYSLSNQSDSLSKLSSSLPEHSQGVHKKLLDASEQIEKQLTQSLGQMERALVGLTNKFSENYEAYLNAETQQPKSR